MDLPVERRVFLKGLGVASAAAVGAGVLSGCSSTKSAAHGPTTVANTGVSAAAPKPGGTLAWATGSEIDGFDPTANHWDQTGYAYARAVFDPLAVIDDKGNLRPYLAQAIDHNEDFTRWTIRLRPNIVFHDGAPLDAAAVATQFEHTAQSPLARATLSLLRSVSTPDPMTVQIDLSSRWSVFGTYLTTQAGYVASPNSWKNADRARQPVGTGPFSLQGWVPGDHATFVRNPHYWRPGLPYLDQITYHPIINSPSAENSLRAGTVDAMFASSTQHIVNFRNDRHYWYIDDSQQTQGEPNVTMLLINTAKKPLDDVRLRQALACATDQQRVIDVAFNGVGQPANGPFFPGSPYYADTGYPRYDLARAKQLMAAVKADHGNFSIKLGTENNSTDLQLIQLLQDMWQQAGIPVELEQVEAATFITNALVGNYDVYTWIQGQALDPDFNYIWWSSATAAPNGQLSLNFTRNRDPLIQSSLDTARATTDPTVKINAYRTVASRLGADVPMVYLARTVSAMMGKLDIQNWRYQTTPEGARAFEYDGVVWPTQLWRG